jgi:hypothetical protein
MLSKVCPQHDNQESRLQEPLYTMLGGPLLYHDTAALYPSIHHEEPQDTIAVFADILTAPYWLESGKQSGYQKYPKPFMAISTKQPSCKAVRFLRLKSR